MIERPFFVVNPKSANGETGKRWETWLKRLITDRFPTARWAFTAASGQGSQLAALALDEGADLVVAVGGDGTVNEVVNGLMGLTLGDSSSGLPGSQGASWPAGAKPPAKSVFSTLPRGSGCDLARGIGIPRDIPAALEILATGRSVPVDVGKIDLRNADGQPIQRYFINISGCGGSGDVVNRVNTSKKTLGPFVAFLSASIASTWKNYSPEVEITIDDLPSHSLKLNTLFVCNGRHCGSGMNVGIDAKMNDGYFDIVELPSSNPLALTLNGAKLYNGKIAKMEGVRMSTGKKVQVTSSLQVLVECDGEQPGQLPATYELLPAALIMIAAPNVSTLL